MPNENDVAPDFELQTDDGSTVRLSDLRGRRVVLYFYPKDDTPGCTTEACEFRDSAADYDAHNALVFGISPDSVKSHAKFRDKFGLNFPLLADPDHEVAARYGVWKEKSFMGRKYMGVARTTFVIGADGRIEKVFENVKAKGHSAEVLGAL